MPSIIMRPLRFILLLTFFVALPVFLTCWSLLSAHDASADQFRVGYTQSTSRLKAFFSFSTPSSLFPPSALISVTNDNSTFFLARPAAFGPSLPSKGLNGELWVGRGFGEEAILDEEEIHIAGWELGCSDVPGWREDERKRLESIKAEGRPVKRSAEKTETEEDPDQDVMAASPQDDGTDDYLHRPLSDSSPAKPGKLGEPANADTTRSKTPTHADIESLQESADIAGKIVLLARGGCGFLEKVKWVQRRGGVALIVGDREKGASLTIMYAKGDTSNVTIPSIFTSWNAAHLLSSMVPSKGAADDSANENPKAGRPGDDGKPVFTSTTTATLSTKTSSDSEDMDDTHGWMHDTLAAIGLTDKSWHQEDTRRPPGSGNIQWVLAENWDDGKDDHLEAPKEGKTFTQTATKPHKTTTTPAQPKSTSAASDDFVIGVQDWRDTHVLEAKQSATGLGRKSGHDQQAGDSPTSTKGPKATDGALKGGSITPGSGEYDEQVAERGKIPSSDGGKKEPKSKPQSRHSRDEKGGRRWFSWFRHKHDCHESKKAFTANNMESKHAAEMAKKKPDTDGLWVTLTPTSVSASPFFDTLLVLVVSPLVTLTVVYALLMLRSRIRRRRWRAPKSLVERLPVRTYHTMSTSSSTTSSQVASPITSAAASPLLVPAGNVSGRPRPRSHTAGSVLPAQAPTRSISRSPPSEKPGKAPKRRKYTARQVECVVCLEDYVDGESRVMSLPCGHEFHADCITPWLVNRRRTCPICKGDVVRSMNRAGGAEEVEDAAPSSDEIQNRVAQTVNEEPSSAIPIPVREEEDMEDADVEQGQNIDEPLLERPPVERQANWRNLLASSLSRLSGDTVWRQTPSDRSR